MKNLKNIIVFALTIPFLVSCGSMMGTAGISNGLKKKSLTVMEAQRLIADGANVKDGWVGKPFVQQAVEQNRWDLVELFVKNGASCFNAPGAYDVKPFSLFAYLIGPGCKLNQQMRLKMIDLCIVSAQNELSVSKPVLEKYLEAIYKVEIISGSFEDAVVKKIEKSGIVSNKERASLKEKMLKNRAESEKKEASYNIINLKLKIATDLDRLILNHGNENNAVIEKFGNEYLPQMMAKFNDRQTKAEEARQNLKDIENELKGSSNVLTIAEIDKKLGEFNNEVRRMRYEYYKSNNDKVKQQELEQKLKSLGEEIERLEEMRDMQRDKNFVPEYYNNPTFIVLTKNYQKAFVEYWAVRFRIAALYAQSRAGVLSADELSTIDNNEAKYF